MEEVNLIYDDYFEDFELENELKLQSYAQLQKIKGEILFEEGEIL